MLKADPATRIEASVMKAHRAVAATVAILAAVPLIGCTAPAEEALPTGGDPVDLDPADFTTVIDNPYWPMEPGTRWTYRESDPEGDLTVFVTVTSTTRTMANGIEARVVRDSVFRGDVLVEDTFDWYAQDADGAIWYLGEDTAEFEDGAVASREGSFEAGLDGALPGIALPGDPAPGMAYRQEYKKGEAEDEGAVLGIDELVEVPYGAYRRALLTRDTTPLEPDVEELKFYARGVGPVLTVTTSGGSGREELVDITTVPDGTSTGPLGSPD
ncbi:hypothetical protein G5T42_12160 [Microbacterium sp. 4R-513]|uniref:hypothetical protein n=1 Tax=Microbacterium sp. 4R-513 TaxID=2567934 RepID=UPI0013E17F88|nr:hypothetical protein [Microbacterium sp. 4R-513]QIG40140.1 hypothetical protein G5T42_12160 [Microbacterium sp. 4R-513]